MSFIKLQIVKWINIKIFIVYITIIKAFFFLLFTIGYRNRTHMLHKNFFLYFFKGLSDFIVYAQIAQVLHED